MTLTQIVKVEEAPWEHWDRIVEGCDYATFFHTRQWAELWQTYSNGEIKPATLAFTFNDGVEAIFPMSRVKVLKGWMQQYYSAAAWMYGGGLSLSNLTPEHHQAMLGYLKKFNLIFRQNPFDLTFGTVEYRWDVEEFTQALDLRPGFAALNEYWAKEHHSIMRAVRKAQKAGIVIEEASDLEEWKEYYQIYLRSQERWGKVRGPKLDWNLFELIFNTQSGNTKLWLAKLDGKIICGQLCFYHNRYAGSWHGAALQEYFKLRPVNLMDYCSIEAACRDNYYWFDFGTSAGLEGVIEYKEKWGCARFPANLVIYRNFIRKSVDNLKERVKEVQLLGASKTD